MQYYKRMSFIKLQHKFMAELACKADPGAKVVSRKEFEKDELGYLEMELPT